MYRAYLNAELNGFERVYRTDAQTINSLSLAKTCESYVSAGYSVVGLERYGDWGSKSGDVVVNKRFELSEKQEKDGAEILATLTSLTGEAGCSWSNETELSSQTILDSGRSVGSFERRETYGIISHYRLDCKLDDEHYVPADASKSRIELGSVVEGLSRQHAIRILPNARLARNGRELYIGTFDGSNGFFPITVLIPGLDVAVVIFSRVNPADARQLYQTSKSIGDICEKLPDGFSSAMCTDIKIIPLRVKATDE